ncbi:MAG: PhoH family protein [Sphingobacteriales bacterium]|nr:PhoH family protein [Sphingobacteriales bacterium]MBP9142202.1 PhoH family protein [Chitinophagales bacterium]MDA0199049.1 PhoH family protein [Bacteroidota bacterium]MBK6889679.1 PhoH family protein [Sphingobacteriales bacterium]MBK7527808.1 PhoH family protein [Sphingobacteriales bacterium]
MAEINLSLEGINPIEFFGIDNAKFNYIRNAFPKLKIVTRGTTIKAIGNENDIKLFSEKVEIVSNFLERYGSVTEKHIEELLAGLEPVDVPKGIDNIIMYGPYGNLIRAKTPNQVRMVKSAEDNDIVFAIGPAGTGKTYTAVALAVKALKNNLVKRIVLTRPAVEAGESLGFLPGDLKDKVDPYLRPLYDALDDMLPVNKLNYFMQNRIIEIAPLAYMRGRTIDNAFIILDEAQNATNLQIKMFLTRIGPSAKCIITGDLTQIDLPRNQKSGLQRALNILQNIDGIATIYLDKEDVIRHKLVKRIIAAYSHADEADEIKNTTPTQQVLITE